MNILNAFSYPTVNDGWDLQSQCMNGMLNLIGYIPLIGTIAGLARLKIANESLTNNLPKREFYKASKFRAYIEIVSCGFIFIIPDLLISIGKSLYFYLV